MDSPQVEIVAAVDIPSATMEGLAQILAGLAVALLPGRRVGLKLMSDDEIRSLNREYRNLDEVTDVLSFPSGLKLTPGAYAGDIALSWPAVQRQAEANGNTALTESAALFAHGALHLLGYTHETDSDQLRMDDLTLQACRSLGIEVERFGH